MLTARGDVIDRVSGLELGADDYVGKPFEPRELVARVQATLRRAESGGVDQSTLRFDGLSIDTDTRSVRVDDNAVDLTSMEYELLLILAKRHGKKLSRDDILSELRGIDAAILTRSVDIMHLSKKQTVELAVELGALDAMALTHTCYEGLRPPCTYLRCLRDF